ncbi:hypothetical protein R3P38DRAFT_3254500 [Favolaschia claudopus]|uniref:Uncharacterized protein n=1 Tax=Favolaschia claudopus TaxID=2862362 RepID=A0AAW0DQT2_9AGAR
MPRRSLLPRKYPVHANDDAAEKRLRREAAKTSEEVVTRTPGKIPIPATITEDAMEKVIRDITDGLQETLRELPKPERFRPKLLGIFLDSDALASLPEEERLREEQAARNWELWTNCVLDSMREPDRQQILREWRAQDESERKWELDQARWEEEQEYPGDMSSSAEYWLPSALLRNIAVLVRKAFAVGVTLPKQLSHRDTLKIDLFKGERFAEFKYPSAPGSVVSYMTYDCACPYHFCGENRRWPCRTLVNAERIEADWAEIRVGSDCREMGPGRRDEFPLFNNWRGSILVGGPLPLPLSSVDNLPVKKLSRGSADNNAHDLFARLEEIDEDYLPQLESVEDSEDESDGEGEGEGREYVLRAKL